MKSTEVLLPKDPILQRDAKKMNGNEYFKKERKSEEKRKEMRSTFVYEPAGA